MSLTKVQVRRERLRDIDRQWLREQLGQLVHHLGQAIAVVEFIGEHHLDADLLESPGIPTLEMDLTAILWVLTHGRETIASNYPH